MPVEDGVEPVEQCPVVPEQPDSFTHAAGVGPRPDVEVVIELQVTDPEVGDQEVDHLIEVPACRRVAEVEVVAVLLDARVRRYARKMPPRAASSPRGCACRPPRARATAREPYRGADGVEHLDNAVRETAGRRSPDTDGVPPGLPSSAYHPESMQNTQPRRSTRPRDERQQAVRGRLAHQGVHVVVEDHGEALVVRVGRVAPPAGKASAVRRRPRGRLR